MPSISSLIETGKVKPIIDGPYPFKDIAQAIALFESGKQIGKIVVTMNN